MMNQQNNEVAIWMYSRAGQLQLTGRPHNSLRTRLRAALVYTYIEREEGDGEGEGRLNSLELLYLQKKYVTLKVR